ncbi:CopG family nickel-responsive transcriptional regulator [Stella humosa]|uniref:Putative nickel-responsive regulator n=1 Tax=Stella humosa TaxID=94 RepID=A0A3N1KSN4_9PROT|nr:nickel-responsive transcriptional regulator NikR [Stella humosa]ROP81126.1 CopG family nickel-responsive transcriptional regulator [Stella humosa]BBK32471.1 nickel-responsive regulator [Stella humosa]
MVQRLTISLDQEVADAIDAFMGRRGYTNRSEAIRDLVRHALADPAVSEPAAATSVAAVSYVYDHHRRQLASRLANVQHDHHGLVVATTHVHLDHHNCLEVCLLRGDTTAVRGFAEAVLSERDVRYGQLNLIPLAGDGDHGHGQE